ncbi:MAG: hypothetical protein ACI920_002400, partial [Saprospiraceae bacterium]
SPCKNAIKFTSYGIGYRGTKIYLNLRQRAFYPASPTSRLN